MKKDEFQKKGKRTKDIESHDPEHKRTRKPGSQSNSSDRHNSGRGGGK